MRQDRSEEKQMKEAPPRSDRARLRLFAWVVLPFLLNDFGNMAVKTFGQFILFDYLAVKAIPLAILGWGLRRGVITWADLGFVRLPLGRMLGLTALLSILSVAMDQYGAPLLERVLPSLRLAFVPWDNASPLFVVDCFLGLGLVALLEEAIFRGLAFSALRGILGQGRAFSLAAAVLFGLIHWSQGLPAVVNAAVIGALFMPVMVRHGTVWPQIAAHFLVDFVFFCKCLAVGPCG